MQGIAETEVYRGMVKLVQVSKTYTRGEAAVPALHEVSLEIGQIGRAHV